MDCGRPHSTLKDVYQDRLRPKTVVQPKFGFWRAKFQLHVPNAQTAWREGQTSLKRTPRL